MLSWSSPWVLLNPLVFWYVAPVYAVHYIVFGDLVLRFGRSNFWVLYGFGCLTGMYEFVITKVYWSPPWNPAASSILGVAWVEFVLIAFVWHAFMSLMMPLRLMQDYVLPGRSATMTTARDVRLLMVIVPFMQGAMGLVVLGNVALTLAAVLGSLGVTTVAVWWFVRAARDANVVRPEDLVLSPKAQRRALVAFAAVYLAYGVALRPEYWGTGAALMLPLGFYGLLIACTAVLLTSPTPAGTETRNFAPAAVPTFDRWRRFVPRYAAQFVVAFLGLAALQGVLAPLVSVIGMLFLIGGFVPAFYLLPRLVREAAKAFRSSRSRAPALASPPVA